MECERDFCLKATELRLGLPGSDDGHELCKQSSCSSPSSTSSSGGSKKRAFVEVDDLSIRSKNNGGGDASTVEIEAMPPPPKAQIVGWPPVRSYRKNNLTNPKKSEADNTTYVKVSMDGAPYLRKMDIYLYKSYPQLLKALNEMFSISIGEYSGTDCYKGSEFALTYEDKDGDWMLVGDVPWEMFVSSCKRLRIMRGADARGLNR